MVGQDAAVLDFDQKKIFVTKDSIYSFCSTCEGPVGGPSSGGIETQYIIMVDLISFIEMNFIIGLFHAV